MYSPYSFYRFSLKFRRIGGFCMFHITPFDRRPKDLFHYLDDMEKSFFGELDTAFSQFRTDILDKGDHFVLQAELPGFSKEDIHIDIDGDYLTIQAEHKSENEEKKENYIRQERHYGSYARSFNVAQINTDKIDASYKDGVLELKLPKRDKTVPPSRQIEIK